MTKLTYCVDIDDSGVEYPATADPQTLAQTILDAVEEYVLGDVAVRLKKKTCMDEWFDTDQSISRREWCRINHPEAQ